MLLADALSCLGACTYAAVILVPCEMVLTLVGAVVVHAWIVADVKSHHVATNVQSNYDKRAPKSE